jgi:hypothetical protein
MRKIVLVAIGLLLLAVPVYASSFGDSLTGSGNWGLKVANALKGGKGLYGQSTNTEGGGSGVYGVSTGRTGRGTKAKVLWDLRPRQVAQPTVFMEERTHLMAGGFTHRTVLIWVVEQPLVTQAILRLERILLLWAKVQQLVVSPQPQWAKVQ